MGKPQCETWKWNPEDSSQRKAIGEIDLARVYNIETGKYHYALRLKEFSCQCKECEKSRQLARELFAFVQMTKPCLLDDENDQALGKQLDREIINAGIKTAQEHELQGAVWMFRGHYGFTGEADSEE